MGSYVEELENDFVKKIKKYRFFDANCWIGKTNKLGPQCLYTVDDLNSYMGYCGIERALVSHHLSMYYHPLVGNELLMKEISGQSNLQGCFVLIPHGTGELGNVEDYIIKMLGQGVRSVRLFPKTHTFSLEEWSSDILLKTLERHRIPLFLWHRETDWHTIHRICSDYTGIPVILEQCDDETFWEGRQIFPLMEACGNLHISVHNCVLYKELDELITRFGEDRVIFGTYYPVDDPHASLMLVTEGDFSSKVKEKIAHGNLENLLNRVVL